jgi:hypothetical protein
MSDNTVVKSVRIPVLTMKKLEEKGIDLSKELKRILNKLAETERCPTCKRPLK